MPIFIYLFIYLLWLALFHNKRNTKLFIVHTVLNLQHYSHKIEGFNYNQI